MKRGDVYRELAATLDRWRAMPPEVLKRRVGDAPEQATIKLANESILIEVHATWASTERDVVRVEAIAFGPNHWRMERIAEVLTIHLVPSAGVKR